MLNGQGLPEGYGNCFLDTCLSLRVAQRPKPVLFPGPSWEKKAEKGATQFLHSPLCQWGTSLSPSSWLKPWAILPDIQIPAQEKLHHFSIRKKRIFIRLPKAVTDSIPLQRTARDGCMDSMAAASLFAAEMRFLSCILQDPSYRNCKQFTPGIRGSEDP